MQAYLYFIAINVLILWGIRFFFNKKLKDYQYLLIEKELIKNDLANKVIEIKNLQEESKKLVEDKFAAMQNEAIAKQQLLSIEQQFNDWEKLKTQSIENAKAAVFEISNKFTNQLIEEHKKENLQQKEANEKFLSNTTSSLYQDFTKISESVAILKEQITTSQKNNDLIYKALLAPTSAGSLAEITLENILKYSNLQANIDYQMQYHVNDAESNKLRPDAVIFLPGDNLLVVDSKASKFFLELANLESNEDQIKIKLLNTMKNHLKSLSNKDYLNAISLAFKGKKINHISVIMFLPSETALEKIQSLDKEFFHDAWKNNIYPSGPVGLINILSYAKFQISEQNKNENYQVILHEVAALLNSISIISSYAKKIGSNIYNSMEYFDKFAASFNMNIITKAKKLQNLGIVTKSNKVISEKIDRYQVINQIKSDNENTTDETLLQITESDNT